MRHPSEAHGRAEAADVGGQAQRLRVMREQDTVLVGAIEESSFSDPWSQRMFAQELLVEPSWHVVATDDRGQVVGFLIGRRYPDEWHLMDLAVAPSCRRTGVARRLVDEFLRAADAAGQAGHPRSAGQQHGGQLALRRIVVSRRSGAGPSTTPRAGGRHGDVPSAAERPVGESAGRVPGATPPSGPLLAIESSCDDSAAAVLTPSGEVLANIVHSQDAIHERYGGVVPEVASRAHVERLTRRGARGPAPGRRRRDGPWAASRPPSGPGLIGALLVGVQTAKAIAWSHGLPFYPVNHLHGHLAAVWLGDPAAPFPMVTLVASGGHTSLIRVDDARTYSLLGQTLDDAAGEAFDKGARLLGLGYPGGRNSTSWPSPGIPGPSTSPSASSARRVPTSRSRA